MRKYSWETYSCSRIFKFKSVFLFSVVQLLFLCYILTYLAFGVMLRTKCFINRNVEARGLSKPGVGASAPRARPQKPP
jgi:hypothetical protein